MDDDGGESIPFSAIRETYEYKAFVTHIRPGTDMEVIKRHISTKLRANVTLIPVSKPGAQILSFGVYFMSERNDLDLKMPGLWPKFARIFKWKANSRGRSGNHSRARARQDLNGHNSTLAGTQAHGQRRQDHSANNQRLRPDQL